MNTAQARASRRALPCAGTTWRATGWRRCCRTSTCRRSTAPTTRSTSCASPTRQWRRTSGSSWPTRTASSCSCSSTWRTTPCSGCVCRWAPGAGSHPGLAAAATTPMSWSRAPPRSSSGPSYDTCWTRCSACCTPTTVSFRVQQVHTYHAMFQTTNFCSII